MQEATQNTNSLSGFTASPHGATAQPGSIDLLPPGVTRNAVLQGLLPTERSALERYLEPVRLDAGEVLLDRGSAITHVWFPENVVGVVRLPIDERGTLADVMTLGAETVIGLQAALGGTISQEQVTVRIAGRASRVRVADLQRALFDSPGLQDAFLGHARLVLLQLEQTIVCSRAHSLEERLAGLLLRIQDQAATPEFACTHEQLANMLRVRRAGVTEAAVRMRRKGIIGHGRGRLSIRDRDALLATSCVCYRLIDRPQHRVADQEA